MKQNRFYLFFIPLITILVFSTVFILSGCYTWMAYNAEPEEKIERAVSDFSDIETKEDNGASEFDVGELESDGEISV